MESFEDDEKDFEYMMEISTPNAKTNAKISDIKTIKDSLSDLKIYKRYE